MEKYNYIHIPKTGGSLFRQNILQNKIDFVIDMDHETRYDSNSKNITFIRSPFFRTLSHYNEFKNNNVKEIKFKDWFTEHYQNYQTKFLIDRVLGKNLILNKENFKRLIEKLKTFYCILDTEYLSRDLPKLFECMGVEYKIKYWNVTKKRYTPTNEEMELILSKNKYDLRLYKFVTTTKFKQQFK